MTRNISGTYVLVTLKSALRRDLFRVTCITSAVNTDSFNLISQLGKVLDMADDVILTGSTSCRSLVLLLWIAAEIASQNIIGAWKRKFQVLPAYIIANSGETN